jgi:hypothetical protein
MLSHRKSLAALAAAAAAVAVAVPVTSAKAATVDPTVCQLINISAGPFGPTAFVGGASLGSVLANAGASVGCAAPPARPSLLFSIRR